MAENIEEFREEFFNKYCDEDEDEIEDLDLDKIKEIYN